MAFNDFSALAESCNSPNFDTKLDENFTALGGNPAGTAALSGAGAVPITARVALWTTTSADAGTLADGVAGQRLTVILVTDGGDGTLTPANAGGWTTITFADAGDCAELLFINSAWYLVGQGGLTTGPLTA